MTCLPSLQLYSTPLGHELVIWKGLREESNHRPLYVKPQRGVKVLDTQPGSPARYAGIKSGDIILAVNGKDIDHTVDFDNMVKNKRVIKTAIRRDNQVIYLSIHSNDGNLGLIPVPEDPVARYMEIKEDSLFLMARRIWKKTKTRAGFFKG